MEKFEEARLKAKKNIRVADHMLTQTYPLVNDPRLLLAVLENVFLSLTNAIGAVLYYELLHKRVPPFQDNFESKFNIFKLKIVEKHNINKEYLAFIQDIKNMIVARKKSPIEFVRKDVFVICNGNYSMQAINVKEMKKYIMRTKSFVTEMDTIITREEHLFSRGVMR